VALTFLVPSAAADAGGHSAFTGGLLAHDGPTEVPVTVVIGCDLVLTTGGGTATVSMEELPTWLSAAPQSFEVEPTECLPGALENITREIKMAVTPAASAPGLVAASLNATVTYTGAVRGNASAAIEVPPAAVAYRPGHRITPEGDQTFTVPATGAFTFDLTIEVLANARTMVMFEDKVMSDPSAFITGLKAHTYDVAAGETRETRKVVFTPPEGAWESMTVKFRTFSHCLDGPDCGETGERIVTWTFVNQTPGVAPGAEAETKDAPGFTPFAMLAVVALALLLRRRQP
jgi:MYXO-CTERM domain-containing protein